MECFETSTIFITSKQIATPNRYTLVRNFRTFYATLTIVSDAFTVLTQSRPCFFGLWAEESAIHRGSSRVQGIQGEGAIINTLICAIYTEAWPFLQLFQFGNRVVKLIGCRYAKLRVMNVISLCVCYTLSWSWQEHRLKYFHFSLWCMLWVTCN